MATKKKTYKNSFMGVGFSPLPEPCKECYGFSNWSGDRDKIVYEDRDCDNCKEKP